LIPAAPAARKTSHATIRTASTSIRIEYLSAREHVLPCARLPGSEDSWRKTPVGNSRSIQLRHGAASCMHVRGPSWP
jgi:hypothetical protein